jgi:predicted Zn-dependent protease
MSGLARWAGVVALAIGAGSCATNPVTGKSELSLVSEGQEIQMGKQTAQSALATYGAYDHNGAQALVRKMGMQMARASERPDLPWEFHVIDDPQINAFAAPGGFIFITRGILAHMNSEAELASVVGHEIGHVTARHSAQQISKQQLATGGLALGMIFSETVRQMGGGLMQGLQLLFLKFGRDDESQADALGFSYMTAAGYDPHGAAEMFRTLDRVSGQGGQRLPEWASTHPDPANRVERAEARADSLERARRDAAQLREGRDTFVRMLDGMTYGEDPKNGFFRGQTFYHPGLRFQMTFPEGWRTANMPTQVAAQAPSGDAALQLGFAKGSPEQAAREFFAQQGMQSENVRSDRVNGLPATTGDFLAQLEDGTAILGSAAFVAYGGRTYGLLGYAKRGRGGASDASLLEAFRRHLESFGPVTDESVLNVSAQRIEVVPVARGMTVNEFNRRHPSTVPVEQVALINGVAGPEATLEGGVAKRVVGGGGRAGATARAGSGEGR